MRGVLPGNGVRTGPACDELPSSENIRPIEDNGRWIVFSKPLMAAFSSSPLYSFEEVDLRGAEDSPSIEWREVTSGRLRLDFSDS
jgi:hypothetical protein